MSFVAKATSCGMEDDVLGDDSLLSYFLSGDEAAVGREGQPLGLTAEGTGLSPGLDDLGVGQAYGLDIDGLGADPGADDGPQGGLSPVGGAGTLPTAEGNAASYAADPAGAHAAAGYGQAPSLAGPAGPQRSASRSSAGSAAQATPTAAPPDDGGEGGEDPEERRKRRLARNRESARQSRRRKKEKLERLEERLVELSREVAQLRAKRLAEGSKRLMRLRGAAVARMAQMAQGEGGGELQAALDDYSRRFGPDSEERRSVRDYYRQQVEAVVLPPYAQFLLWTMKHSDTFLKIQSGQLVTPESAPPSGDQSIADAARLWRQVREELTLTTEQEHKLLSQLRTHENATGAEERQRLLGALNSLHGLHEALQRSATSIQGHVDQLRAILTPAQYARYLSWVSQNRGRLRACQDGVASSAARSVGGAGPTGSLAAGQQAGGDCEGAAANAGPASEDGQRAGRAQRGAAPLHRAQKLLQSTDEDVSGHDVASVLPLLRR